LIALNTPESDKAGIVRYMTSSPNIKNSLGYIEEKDPKDLTANEMLSPAELISSFTSQHSDAPRQSMQAVQSKHLMPTKNQNKPLVTSGFHKVMPYLIGRDFAYKAKDNGKVVDINKDTGIMVVYYDRLKEYDLVNLNVIQAKNSGGGFYTTNKKNPLVEKGDTFSKDDILALNNSFFKESSVFKNEIFFGLGTLAKIALTSKWSTFEDGSSVSRSLAKKIGSEVTMYKDVVIGPNSNIEKIVNINDKIKTSDPLIVFDTSFKDESINKVLSKLGAKFDQTIAELSKNVVSSKYSGEIADIKITYNVPFETLSPSLKKLINQYKKKNKEKVNYITKTLKKADKEEIKDFCLNPDIFKEDEMVKSDKVNGKAMEGVLIEFFTKTYQEVNVGDKVTYGVAVKSVIGDIMEDNKCPYSEYNKDENIEALLSPISPLNRMCGDFYLHLYVNKVLLELKRQVKEMIEDL